MSKIRLTSLLLVEERLLEADYFSKATATAERFDVRGLSAERVPGCLPQRHFPSAKGDVRSSRLFGLVRAAERERETLRADEAATFFVNLRNYSQHEARVSVVGSASGRNGRFRWSYRLAGAKEPVPKELLHRDLAECCREHLAKLTMVVPACAARFPFATCPKRALSPEGIRSLRISIKDVEELRGFRRGWTNTDQADDHEARLRALQAHVDGVDFRTIQCLSRVRVRGRANGSLDFSEKLLVGLVDELEARRARNRDTQPDAIGSRDTAKDRPS